MMRRLTQGADSSQKGVASSSAAVPEGNFRLNEPSAHSELSSLSCVKILWIDESSIAESVLSSYTTSLDENAGFSVSAAKFVKGTALRMRLLEELHQNLVVPLKDLVDAFPAASEYFRESGSLRMIIEEAPINHNSVQISRWENVFAAKRFAVVLTMLRSSADTTPQEFSKRLSEVKAMFLDSKYSSSLRRCIVIDPPAQFASSLETDYFLIVRSSTSLAEVARSLMHDIAADVVHHITSRILALSLNTSYSEALGSFKTPLDKQEFDGPLDPRSELSKIIRSRASKRRGDLLLQLEAPDAALLAYGEVTIAATDSLWVAAHLESVASARYLEGRSLIPAISDWKDVCAEIGLGDANTKLPDAIVLKLNRVENEARDALMRYRKAVLSLGNALPTLTKQRLLKEVEEPMVDKVEKFCASAQSLRSASSAAAASVLSSSSASTANVGAQTQSAASGQQQLTPEAALPLFKELFDQIVSLWFSEIELLLVEAYHHYRTLQPRLFELESELYLKLAWLRADQRNSKKTLEAIADLTKTLKFVSPEAALRVIRVVPDVCIRCGCKRKAVQMVVDAAQRDKRAGNYDAALKSLFRAAEWCNIPIVFDDGSGCIALHPMASSSSSSGSGTTYVHHHSRSGAAAASSVSPMSSGLADDTRNRGNIKLDNPSRAHISLLFEIMEVLRLIGPECRPGLRSQTASAALFLYGELMDAATQNFVLSILQMESNSLPPYLEAIALPPPLLMKMKPSPLPPHLRPQTVSMGGAVFTYIDKERMKMTLLTLNGKKMTNTVVWVAGDVAEVEVQLSNPFDLLLQLTSVALRVEFTPTFAASECLTNTSGLGRDSCAAELVTPYVLHGVVMHPRASITLRLYALLRAPGVVHLSGIEVLIGQLTLVTPVVLPMCPVMDVPVLPPLPRVELLFSVNDVELFAGQTIPVRCTVVNVGGVHVEHLSLTAHTNTCQLVNCEGCRERQSSSGCELAVAVSRLVLQDALPLAPGESIELEALLIAPTAFPKASVDRLVFRVDYDPGYPPPQAPEGIPSSVPVFAVVPRRIMESMLRVFTFPSLVITDLYLTRDRRFVEVRVKNESPRHMIEMLIGGGSVEPFHNVASNPVVLAGAEYILPPIEISKLPDRVDCVFHLPWAVRSGVSAASVTPYDGALLLNLVEVIRDVYSTEPLEEMVVVASFTQPISLWQTGGSGDPRSGSVCNGGEYGGGAESSGNSYAEAPAISSLHHEDSNNLMLLGSSACSGKHTQNWISVAPSRLPVSLPAVRPVSMQMSINAPWKAEISVVIEVFFDTGMDVGMITGPTKKRVPIGRDGGSSFEEVFELCVFKTGEHFLLVRVTDDQQRMIQHAIRLQVEHAVDELH